MPKGTSEDPLYGTEQFLMLLKPAEGVNPQTENERTLKGVIHRLSDVLKILSAELIASREQVGRLGDLVEEKRKEIENIETEEKKARKAELERIRNDYKTEIQKQKNQSTELLKRLKAMDKKVQDRDRELTHRDELLTARNNEIKERDTKITELIRNVGQMEDTLGQTRQARDRELKNVGERTQLADQLLEKLKAKELTLKHNDEEKSTLRERIDELQTRVKATQRANKELEIAIDKVKTDSTYGEKKLKASLSTAQHELEEIKLQGQQFTSSKEFTEKTMQDLIDDNRDKDELIFRSQHVLIDQQIREQEHQDATRFKMNELQEKLSDLRIVDDGLMYAVTSTGRKGGIEPWRVCSPTDTLVQIHPTAIPVVVGDPVTVVVTTRNQTGAPVKGAYPTEFVINVAGNTVATPEMAKELKAPAEPGKKPKPDKESSTFTSTHFATTPGWKPVVVSFRGETIKSGYRVFNTRDEATRSTIIDDTGDLVDAEKETLQTRMSLLVKKATSTPDQVLTISCSPTHAKPGEEVDVFVAVRESLSLRPNMSEKDFSNDIQLSAFFSGAPLKATWLNNLQLHNRVGTSQIYHTRMTLPEDDKLELTGVIGTLGSCTASAICWMRPPTEEGRVDFSKTLLACYQDPCTPGEVVTCLISTRGSEFEPAAIEDGQEVLFTVRGMNGVSKITPVQKVNASTWRTTFVAEKKGRSGVQMEYSGASLGQASVEVQASNRYHPADTTVTLNPKDGAAPGQRVYVTIKTNDLRKHLAAGPPPSAFAVHPVGPVVQSGGHKIHALSRTGVDGIYTTHFTVDEKASVGDNVGVEVTLEGSIIEGACKVTSSTGDYVASDAVAYEDPPLLAAFSTDPVRAEEAAFVMVKSKKEPRVVGGYNVTYVGQPQTVKWAPGMWSIRVQVGPREGHCSVAVDADGATMNVSTSVDTMPVQTLESEIERLRTIETKFRESWGGKWDGSRAGSRAGSMKGSRKSLQLDMDDEPDMTPEKRMSLKSTRASIHMDASPKKGRRLVYYPKIGVELAEHVAEVGAEKIEGARVVDVKYGEAADAAGLQQHDILTEIQAKGTFRPSKVTCTHDFKVFLKSLGNEIPFPDLLLTVRRTDAAAETDTVVHLVLVPGVSEKEVFKKKTRTTSRRRSRGSGSLSPSSKKKSSKRKKKKSTKKKSTKKKSTKKKSTKKKSTKTKSGKKLTKKKSSKKKGLMRNSEFQRAGRLGL
ncbi:hypothetical protein DIPPA_19335 [Diplonema papillatum]|nr:hypothetical protein DIPPA_19335 [Diplonema papillatum]